MCYHLSAVAIAGLLKKKAIHKQPIISGGGITNVVTIGKSAFYLKFSIKNRESNCALVKFAITLVMKIESFNRFSLGLLTYFWSWGTLLISLRPQLCQLMFSK